MENMVLCGTLPKSVSEVGFWGKAAFLESISFHSQMLVATNFGLVQGDRIIIANIFINTNIVNFTRISFYELLKIPIVMISAMFEKLCLIFSSSKVKKKFLNIKNPRHTPWPHWKNAQRVSLGIWLTQKFLITSFF